MPVSRSMWLRDLQQAAAKRRSQVRHERDIEIRAITSDWKEGYRELKGENDTRQERLEKFEKEQMGEIDSWLKEEIAKGPPK